MPDSRSREPMPRDWGDAFGALPLETPPTDSWQRLAAALPVRGTAGQRPRWRHPAIAAMAAAIALAAILPVWQRDEGADAGTPADAKSSAPPPLAATLEQHVAAEDEPPGDVALASPPPPVSEQTPKPRHPRQALPTAHLAKVEQEQAARERVTLLQAESARLEALLATSGQTQVVNAGVQVVSGQLAASIGAIDDTLANSSQSDSIESLWLRRNALLKQMLSLELRQRQVADVQMPPFQIAQIN